MSTIRRTGAVITAAGMSTRMGDFKQTLPFAGMTIVEFVVTHFMNVGVSEIAVVAGYRAGDVRECLEGYPVTILENRDYATTQMFDSVKIGLNYIMDKCDRCFLTPVDVPAFDERTLIAELSAGERLVYPVTDGMTGHPILFDSSLIPSILAFDGDGGLRGAFESLEVSPCLLDVGDALSLLDADTPEDYRKILELYEQKTKKG